MRSQLKKIIPKRLLSLYHKKRKERLVYKNLKPKHKRHCSICKVDSYFLHWPGPPIIPEFVCPNCDSHSRQRLLAKYIASGELKIEGAILHFAAELNLRNIIEPKSSSYQTADLFNSADLKINIENIILPDATYDTIVINHVLEHVSQYKKAIQELARITKPGGQCIITVPQQIGYETTYEDNTITTPSMRELHFGQFDHLRVYGNDFREILLQNGFCKITELVSTVDDCIKMSCTPGERIFVCIR